MSDAKELLSNGKLTEAIEGTTAQGKPAPKDMALRWLLAELLIHKGENDRADKQLDALVTLDPRVAVSATPIRQLLRAEQARRQFYEEGRVPAFLDGATPAIHQRLESFVLLRDGKGKQAGDIAKQAEAARPELSGKCVVNSEEISFKDIRDLDDITASVFEVFTCTGKYYWIDMSQVERIEFVKPERPLDLIWRKARLVVREAFDAEVHIPAVYGNLTGADDATRLGRKTEWIGADEDAVTGVGRRSFVLDGETEIDIMSIETIDFS